LPHGSELRPEERTVHLTPPWRAGAHSGSNSTQSSAHQPTLVAIGTLFGDRFEVIDALGRGGMGEVFLVRDRQIEKREVALKLIRERWSKKAQFRDLFFQEIRAAQKFVSPYVVQVRDCGQLPDGRLFMTMDHVVGESLEKILARERNLRPRHALEIARQVLLGLSSGHERGLVHRDVKPSNVMLASRVPKSDTNPFGVQVGLLDFGLAALSQDIDSGKSPGTPYYMSPEQVAGERIDARSDLFAVGVMLFEMISGQRPFQGQTEQEITTSVIETDPRPLIENLDGVGKSIRVILKKALQKQRESRFASAAQFLEAIENSSSFRAEGGAPRWVVGAAATFGASTVVLGALYASDHVYSVSGQAVHDSRYQAMNVELTALRARERDFDQTSRDNIRLQQDSRTQESELSKSTQRIGELEATTAALNKELNNALEASQDSAIAKNELDLGAEKRVNVAMNVISHLNAVIERLTNHATHDYIVGIGHMGSILDGLLRDITSSRIMPDSRKIESAVLYRWIPSGMPGIEYLRSLESVASKLAALKGRTTEITWAETSKQVIALRQEFERDLKHPSVRDAFHEAAGERKNAEYAWLGHRQLKPDEVDDLMFRIAETRSRALSMEKPPAAVPSEAASTEEKFRGVSAAQVVEFSPETLKADVLARLRLLSNSEVRTDLHRAALEDGVEERRIEQIDKCLELLSAGISEMEEMIRLDADSAAQAITINESSGSPAARLIAYFDEFGSLAAEFSPRLVEHVANDLSRRTTRDGTLDIIGLSAMAEGLVGLVDRLHRRDVPGIEHVERQAIDSLSWYALALIWYIDRSAADPPAWSKALLEAPLSMLADEWRQVLSIQIQLSSNESVHLPLRAGSTAVFLERGGDNELTGWSLMYAREVSNVERAIMLDESRFERDGRPKPRARSERSLRRANERLELQGRTLIDLRDAPNSGIHRVVSWDYDEGARREFDEMLPSSLTNGLSRLTSLAFLMRGSRSSGTLDEPQVCLEVRASDELVVWLHPVLGIVREKAPRLVRELVHISP